MSDNCERTSPEIASLAARQMHSRKRIYRRVAASALRARKRVVRKRTSTKRYSGKR
jgi:hypothetical protein